MQILDGFVVKVHNMVVHQWGSHDCKPPTLILGENSIYFSSWKLCPKISESDIFQVPLSINLTRLSSSPSISGVEMGVTCQNLFLNLKIVTELSDTMKIHS